MPVMAPLDKKQKEQEPVNLHEKSNVSVDKHLEIEVRVHVYRFVRVKIKKEWKLT